MQKCTGTVNKRYLVDVEPPDCENHGHHPEIIKKMEITNIACASVLNRLGVLVCDSRKQGVLGS